MQSVRSHRRSQVKLLSWVIVFASGASALTYEVIWQREMFHVFGASAPATAAILTAIFLGIALGSRLSTPLLRRYPRPLVLLALLEGVIGLWGLLVPTMMELAERIYIAIAHTVGEEAAVLDGARFVLAILTVLPATLCMGATLPVMVRAFEHRQTSAVAWVYGMNILGAVVGAVTTGLVWIRLLGQSDAVWVAAGLNLMVVLCAAGLARRGSVAGDVSEDVADNVPFVKNVPWLRSLYFAAGFVALGLEVVWLRYLGIVSSNSTVTFSLTLAFYLCGMGLGSLALYPVLRRWASPGQLLALGNGGVAVASLLTFPIIFAAPYFNRSGIEIPSMTGTLTLADLYLTEAKIIALLLFVPTLAMGLVFPAVCDCVPQQSPGRQRWIGSAYFLGTMGSVAGIVSISLLVIPQLGLHATFAGLVALSALLGAITCVRACAGPARLLGLIVLGVAVVAAGGIAVDRRPVLRNSIAREVDGAWLEFDVEYEQQPMTRIVRFKAGATGTVITKEETRSPDRLIYVDDQLVASTNIEAKVDALMLAHLPLLLHPAPQNELTVGFGTGGTSHAITTHGIDAFCVEIEPEVPRSAHLLTGQNYGILEHPRFELILNDARDHLQITRRSYDVIATDVTNLQYKQNSSLYTVEYFELMRSRLRAGGIACAWIPMAAIARSELQTLLKSFQHVFEHATLWFMNHTHTNFGILIGTPERLQIDYARLKEGFADPAIAASLREIGMVEPMQLVHCLHLDEEGYRAFCGAAALHTDDRPILEFSSPLSFYQYSETFADNLAASLQHRPADMHPFVAGGPPADAPQWSRHQQASQAGCEVILSMYRYQIARARGDRPLALEYLKQSLAWAKAGMDAWPEDTTRETFYIQFFEDANRWASAPLR